VRRLQKMTGYTITGASDWDMLVTIGGITAVVFSVVVATLIGVIYKSLPKKADLDMVLTAVGDDLEKLGCRFESALEKMGLHHETNRLRDIDALWKELREGREKCTNHQNQRFTKIWRAIQGCQQECCDKKITAQDDEG
jgi:hypothetical protein